MKHHFLSRASKAVLMTALAAALGATAARADDSLSLISPKAADRIAAKRATVIHRHARPANTEAGKFFKNTGRPVAPRSSPAAWERSEQPHRYPGDLSYLGGPVVESAESHAIYMLPNGHCPIPQCWGNPEGFLRDLGRSDFIHLVDQYIGLSGDDRYTVAPRTKIRYTPPAAPFTDNDMLAVVHAVASATMQTGYGHIYHVFLPPGQDECFTATDGVCYSPDNPNTFFFCAYHGSVDFTDIGHVLYSVEPYQNVGGCSVKPGTPNGQVIDSTNNSLSHETIETITDPDGDAWINFSLVVLAGSEIGDECSFFIILPPAPGTAYFDPFSFEIGNHDYAVQPEYSNSDHDCATGP
jgi:hypothetical protein